MLSRLSGLASTVLHELSGEGEDGGTAPSPAGPEFESSQQNGEETPEDVLERLAHMEKLVAQLKTLVREKDTQLHQKEVTLQEERQAADAKLLKLKLQAKVKVANLNKRIEELTAQGGAAPAEGQPEGPPPPVQGDHGLSDGTVDEMGVLRRQLQEQEEMVTELRGQLEEATGRLGDAQAQISSLQREVLEKESLREEQALQHQAEIHQVEAWSAREAEMQQNLRQLQRKVEEQEEALLGRTQVVELLQQELNSSQEEKQNLLEKLQKAEAELDNSRSTLASAQEESLNLVRRLELELAEQKKAFQQSQEEVQELSQELSRARAAQAEREQERQAEEARHALEVAKKNEEMAELQKAEQDLHASYEAVQAENARLRQKGDVPPESLPDDASAMQGKAPERPSELGLSQPELETAAVPSPPLDQASAGQTLEEPLPAQPDGQPDLQESFAEEKQRDLSILLLELQEAQEEIAFLKGQLPLSSSLEAEAGGPQGSDGEREGEGAVPIQSDSSSSSLVTVDIQDSPPALGLLLGPEENETAQGPSPDSGLQLQEITRLELEVAELQRRQQEAVETHQRILEEKNTEIDQLQEQVEASARAAETLDAEQDQLLSHLKELCFLAELKAQPEGIRAHPELQPQLPNYESGISHLGLLKEQIQSLRNEAQSKDVKIVALQNDLDKAQRQISEQETMGRNLLSQLQKEQQNGRALVEQVQEASAKAEEQSQALALKELEATKLATLLSENSLEVERLQQEVLERERRMAEVSVGMSDRMVQLNEEKFVLGKELKNAMEQLSILQQGKETREQAVETEESRPLTEELPVGEAAEVLRKENELMRKKLQAALLSRKELLGRVRQLEQEGKGGEELPAESQEGLAQENEGGGHLSESHSSQGHPVRRGRAASLNQLPSTKEATSQVTPEEEECTWPRTVIAELQQSLQQKDLQINALQAELKDCKLSPEKQSPADQNLEGSSSADSGAGRSSSNADLDPEGGNKTFQEEFSALVQEREELQKKLQEALVSRKETIKKAKEKDRHYRELLKQQKNDYKLLQEQFEQESRENENLHDQLQSLSKALESFPPQKPAGDVSSEDPASGLVQEFGQEVLEERTSLAAEDSVVGQLKADFEKLQTENRELEAHLTHLEGELDAKSEKILLLQEKVEQLLAEVEMAKAACSQAEASMESLKLELQESQEEIARQEKLKCHQEEKELNSREEIQGLRSQLADKNVSLGGLQAELQERENRIQALQAQLDQAQQLQVELQVKSAETQSKAQLQRKLQAALISRKEALKESKGLKDELSGTKATLESTSLHLQEVELRASELDKEKVVLLERLATLKEERDKLISAVDNALVENQNVTGSCESLKLALEGVTQEKTRLEEEMDSLKERQAQELSEWRRKHEEMQKEYETLLQSYENVSDEAERIQRLMENIRQEKQDLFLRLKEVEAEKKDGEARLQGAEQEMEGMREKMRKFAKSKQQKILELEEENEQLRLEIHPGDGRQDGTNSLREELETSKKNCQALSDEVKALVAEKDLLKQEIQDLRQMLQNKEDQNGTQEEMVARSKGVGSTMMSSSEKVAEEEGDPDTGSEVLTAVTPSLEDKKEELSTAGPLCDERVGDSQQVAELQEQMAALEDKRKMAVEEMNKAHGDLEVLKEEKNRLEGLLAVKGQELEALQEKIIKMEEACGQTKEQLAEALTLKEALETEKDDLEERLMNQLAELNGSIGNYQQDMANLESKNQQLFSEMEGLRGALSLLEDEKRHLLREKLEVEAEKKENVEKVKSAWKEDNGRTQTRELQELLKEKQQEVRQLQRDCIKSQEKISGLERTIKALEFIQNESKKELETTKKSMVEAEEKTKKVQAELASCRVLLDDTQSEAARVVAESLKVKEELQATQAQVRSQLSQKEKELERHVEQEKAKHLKEIRNMDERLEALRKKQAFAEESAQDLQVSLRQKDQEAKQLQGSLNHTLAQLAAFTRSMSSLQDDRDRVIDESRQWEKKFSEAIEKKEQELSAREEACAALQDQAKKMALQVEDLQGLVASLERSQSAQESHAQEELQHHREEVGLLQEEKHRLGLQLEEVQRLLSHSQSQVLQQGGELGSLRKQLADLQASFEDCDRARLERSETVKSHEASLQDCRLSLEQLEADLRASKELTERLHNEVSDKEQKIVGLVAAKEEAVAEALLEIQEQHKEDLKELENQMAKAEAEKVALEAEKAKAQEKVNGLMEKLKNIYEESKQHKAQLDSFTKSMSSLQDDRDRILENYRQLEQRHLAAILEKDQLIQEAASENNSLKEQLRSLHGQMDDLHAENAKLDAELVRYREDLNQVISIKDTQQKQLLKTQIDRIQALEKEKAGVEGQLRESELSSASLQRTVEALQLEKQNLEQEVKALKSSLSQLQDEMLVLREGGCMLELQLQLQEKVDEIQSLGGQLSLANQQVAGLEEELALLHQKLQDAEAKMKKELKSFHHDTGLLRNETETAEQRVAELAKDLLQMEQNLLVVTEENQDLKAQIQSFKKAMSSLQDSWDQSHEERRALEKKYAAELEEQRQLVQSLHQEKLHAQETQTTLEKQRDSLTSELAALRDSTEEKGFSEKLEKLNQQLQSKDSQLARLSSELEKASGQVKAFSQAMASLQTERDRLLSELDKTHKTEEVKLQSAANVSSSLAETSSLKKALSSLQNDRDRLLEELKKLQQQHLQVGVDTAEISRLKAQLQQKQQEMEQQQELFQEKLKQERTSVELELQQLREEKAGWEQVRRQSSASSPQAAEKQRKEGSSGTTSSDRDTSGQMASVEDLQVQLGNSLKHLHQKELRIQQLNSKLSQVFEEKNALTLQLRGSSRSLRESHQQHNEALSRCAALEKQLQEWQGPAKTVGPLLTDATPGAPQEKDETNARELQELQTQLSEAKHQQSLARQGLTQLQQLLQEEQERRLAAEEACSAAQEQMRRLESEEYVQSLETSIAMPPTSEHARLLGSAESSFSKARGARGLQRALRSVFCPRRLFSLLATVYLFGIHVLLFLHAAGRL